jgi:hypothetical protein
VRVLSSHSDEAGSEVLQYYERRLKAWRKSLRWPFVVAALWAIGMSVPVWLYLPHGQFVAGAFIGATEAFILLVRDTPPDFIAKWKRGWEGERKTRKVLRRLERDGWKSFHGRKARYGDLDHVVVGPAGVFVLDSKNLNGRLSIEAAGLTATYGDAACDAFTLNRLGGWLTREAIRLKELIAAATGLTYRVQAVVVVWGDFPEREAYQGNVVYIAGDVLGGWLQEKKQRLSNRDVQLIQAGLEAEIIIGAAEPLIEVA